ncbi:hypothetical protein LTR66_004702 [Elasticomyces elasticus]|nr:hypothetical protein LTR66_004702 [Elasticomyces elasticus]
MDHEQRREIPYSMNIGMKRTLSLPESTGCKQSQTFNFINLNGPTDAQKATTKYFVRSRAARTSWTAQSRALREARRLGKKVPRRGLEPKPRPTDSTPATIIHDETTNQSATSLSREKLTETLSDKAKAHPALLKRDGIQDISNVKKEEGRTACGTVRVRRKSVEVEKTLLPGVGCGNLLEDFTAPAQRFVSQMFRYHHDVILPSSMRALQAGPTDEPTFGTYLYSRACANKAYMLSLSAMAAGFLQAKGDPQVTRPKLLWLRGQTIAAINEVLGPQGNVTDALMGSVYMMAMWEFWYGDIEICLRVHRPALRRMIDMLGGFENMDGNVPAIRYIMAGDRLWSTRDGGTLFFPEAATVYATQISDAVAARLSTRHTHGVM